MYRLLVRVHWYSSLPAEKNLFAKAIFTQKTKNNKLVFVDQFVELMMREMWLGKIWAEREFDQKEKNYDVLWLLQSLQQLTSGINDTRNRYYSLYHTIKDFYKICHFCITLLKSTVSPPFLMYGILSNSGIKSHIASGCLYFLVACTIIWVLLIKINSTTRSFKRVKRIQL